MSKVYMLLADGFEEIEALTPVDVLRRDGIEVITVSVMGRNTVDGAHGITIATDMVLDKKTIGTVLDGDMLLLPGGPGHKVLAESEAVQEIINDYNKNEKKLAAICAAPSIFGRMGLLDGKKATCFPGFEEYMKGAELVEASVVTDGRFTTAKGMGVSLPFALELVKVLDSGANASELAKKLQCD